MNKKFLLIVVVFCVVAIANVHAFGIGAQVNFNTYTNFFSDGEEGSSFAPGFSLLVSPSSKFHIAGNWYIDVSDPDYRANIIGLTLDYRFWNPRLIPRPRMELVASKKPVRFHLNTAVGAYFDFRIPNSESPEAELYSAKILGGIRVPIGFSLYLFDRLEIFTNVAPSFGITFNRVEGENIFSSPFFPVAIGARFWF